MEPTAYEYDVLPPGENFRYLVLQPGSVDQPLVCSLVTAPLAGTQFEAVSYVWGSPVRDQVILCDEKPLEITSSLHEVLCSLRFPNAPRQLWADGVCIDQDDTTEKGHQVGFMSEIYREAKCVLMYAGSDCEEDGEKVSTLLRDVGGSIDKNLSKLDPSAFDSYPWPASDDPLVTDTRWSSLSCLLRTDWFKRGWVLREAALAQAGLLLWGKNEYKWKDLMLVLVWAYYRVYLVGSKDLIESYPYTHIVAYRDRHIASLRAFFHEYQSQPWHLLDYLRHDLSFSDPRDRIYAFLDLTTESLDELVLDPDYDSPVEEVFHDFAKKYIQGTGGLWILDHVVQFIQAPPSDLPSWVPRWDLIASETTPLAWTERMLRPKNGAARRPEVVDRATLKLHGVVFDSVRFLSEVFHHDTTKPKDVLSLMTYVLSDERPSPYPSAVRLSAFLETLVRNTYSGDLHAWELAQWSYAHRLYEHLNSQSSFEWDSCDHEAERLFFVQRLINENTRETRFMITQRGYMGLAPAIAQEGDLCCIIFGCGSPSLIRPVPAASESTYTLLGSAFVLGSEYVEAGASTTDSSDEYALERHVSSSSPTRATSTRPGSADESVVPISDWRAFNHFGDEYDKSWVNWVEEQDIYLV